MGWCVLLTCTLSHTHSLHCPRRSNFRAKRCTHRRLRTVYLMVLWQNLLSILCILTEVLLHAHAKRRKGFNDFKSCTFIGRFPCDTLASMAVEGLISLLDRLKAKLTNEKLHSLPALARLQKEENILSFRFRFRAYSCKQRGENQSNWHRLTAQGCLIYGEKTNEQNSMSEMEYCDATQCTVSTNPLVVCSARGETTGPNFIRLRAVSSKEVHSSRR